MKNQMLITTIGCDKPATKKKTHYALSVNRDVWRDFRAVGIRQGKTAASMLRRFIQKTVDDNNRHTGGG